MGERSLPSNRPLDRRDEFNDVRQLAIVEVARQPPQQGLLFRATRRQEALVDHAAEQLGQADAEHVGRRSNRLQLRQANWL